MSFKKLILSILPIFLLSACNLDFGLDFGDEEETSEVEQPKTKYSLSETDITMGIGDTHQIYMLQNGYKISTQSIDWVSSNDAVASVTNGLIRAYSLGMVNITAYYAGQALKCYVNVDHENVEYELDFDSLWLQMDDEPFQIHALRNGVDMNPYSVQWVSSNTGVAHVNSQGIVTPVSEGEAEIYAHVEGIILTCQVKVFDNRYIKFEHERIGLNLHGSVYNPLIDTRGRSIDTSSIEWYVGVSSVANVYNGTVYANGVGSTEIMAYYNGYGFSYDLTVYPQGHDLECFINTNAQTYNGNEYVLELQHDNNEDRLTMTYDLSTDVTHLLFEENANVILSNDLQATLQCSIYFDKGYYTDGLFRCYLQSEIGDILFDLDKSYISFNPSNKTMQFNGENLADMMICSYSQNIDPESFTNYDYSLMWEFMYKMNDFFVNYFAQNVPSFDLF